jgi:hypothetical protein
MANLTLTAATLKPFGLTAASGLLPASETALTGFTGFQFPNNPAGLVIVHLVVGSAGTGSLQFIAQVGSNPAAITVANSSSYLFGPFDPSIYSDPTGTVFATLSVVTGNSVGIYLLNNPGQTLLTAFGQNEGFRALHNPLEMTVGATDW